MTRTVGSRNVKLFEHRDKIESSSNTEIKHLAKSTSKSALDQFRIILNHQRNYIKWIESRHDELIILKRGNGSRAPKDSTYRKYQWHAEQNSLLESINSFEVFYKRSIINLAKALRNYIPAERLKGSVDSRILWSVSGKFSIAELIFEHQLYHDLDNIDSATNTLIQDKYYNKSNLKSKRAKLNTKLQAVFQIRHTLSHNYGLITRSDKGKFKMFGFHSDWNQIIDPNKNDFGLSISRFLEKEASSFTTWLVDSTAKYLDNLSKNSGIILNKRVLTRIQRDIGDSNSLRSLPWI